MLHATTSSLDALRDAIRDDHLRPGDDILRHLATRFPVSADLRERAARRGADLVRRIRHDKRPGLMEVFLAEYELTTSEGVALMCLAEALLRVPDAETVDDLIEDKIAPSDWDSHLGHSQSSLVNASTWALMLTGRVLREDTRGVASTLRGLVRRMGEPVIRITVGRIMERMGHQFVLGEDIGEAIDRGRPALRKGYTFSYDMLGEAAMTEPDAEEFYAAYDSAIAQLAKRARGKSVADNPGISVKLSALHPRYEDVQRDLVMGPLLERARTLARKTAKADMGFNIDAEEQGRLDISLDVIEALARDPETAGWDGFGVVVQAYGKRAPAVLDWLHALAGETGRRIMVRLVKGAYWDTEVKLAQVQGVEGFPVFTRKAATDVTYLHCAEQLLGMTDRLFPQFATHNAHTAAAILEMAGDRDAFEFQRLHGMGEALHDILIEEAGVRSRIYAPVGPHEDLLAYLVRRLLENGANSSFVNQLVDPEVPPEQVASDPFARLATARRPEAVVDPRELWPDRRNSRGFDLADRRVRGEIDAARAPFAAHLWHAGPLMAGDPEGGAALDVANPARPDERVGTVVEATAADADHAVAAAEPWTADVAERARVLARASDLLEEHFGEVFAVVAREAGKSPKDVVAELREAVDFLRYYAARAKIDAAEGKPDAPRGTIVCISPWNFPLAIFTGQVAAALATGNAVIAKPAEATVLTAHLATRLLHEAGVPRAALQFLPGQGGELGAALTSDPRIAGAAFTGSIATGGAIHRALAAHAEPDAMLIAETGGLNAMIVDSTALPEQAVRDVVASAFQSAGQRCSALRMLYVQEDGYERLMRMLQGAIEVQRLGDPWDYATDVGPVIDAEAKAGIEAHIETARRAGRLLYQREAPRDGHFVGPAILGVNGIEDLEEEVFGPVLHVAAYKAHELEEVIETINAKGYGLTFGIHSRIDDRVDVADGLIRVGNVYVNRNQIGAIVGSNPFGGEGLSGTGPKAGGPNYLDAFRRRPSERREGVEAPAAEPAAVQRALDAARHAPVRLREIDMPGPTGEANRLRILGRGLVLCLGPDAEAARAQAELARAAGCQPIVVAPGADGSNAVAGLLPPEALRGLDGLAAVIDWGDVERQRAVRRALAGREGLIVPLVTGRDPGPALWHERHLCIDTTAAGGNATLLARAS